MKALLPACALLLCASSASAQVNLGWNDCPAGATYAANQTFACDVNTTTPVHTLVGSFVAPSGVQAMSANEIVVDLQASAATLPDWWAFQGGGCRSSSLSSNANFTTGPATCTDYWKGGATGSVTFTPAFGAPNRARITGIFSLPVGDSRITAIPQGTEVYSFKLLINNFRTVDNATAPACAGCQDPFCIVLNSVKIDQPSAYADIPYLYLPATRNWVTWQGGGTLICPADVPVRAHTWGEMKSLYR